MELVRCTLFPLCVVFCPIEFFQHKVFNEATWAHYLLSNFKCHRSGYMRVICNLNALHSFFLLTVFFLLGFRLKVFNEAIKDTSKEEQIRSSNNLADLFTKSLSTSTFEKIVYGIGMRRANKLHDSDCYFQGEQYGLEVHYTLFFFMIGFCPTGFFGLRFLTRQLQNVQEYQYDTSSKEECYELSWIIIMIIILILSYVIILWTIYHIDNIHVNLLGL